MLGLVIAGFIVGEQYHIRPGTVAMVGATVLLLVSSVGPGHKGQAGRLHDTFGRFALYGLPVMIFSIVLANIYVYLRFFA